MKYQDYLKKKIVDELFRIRPALEFARQTIDSIEICGGVSSVDYRVLLSAYKEIVQVYAVMGVYTDRFRDASISASKGKLEKMMRKLEESIIDLTMIR